NRYSMVQFETNRYSVPTIYVGEKVTVKATADEVKILFKGTIIASHPRIYGRYQEQIKLDHYLELLLQKSRALDNTKVYKPQLLAPVYEQYRRNLNARSHKGNKEFVKILMLHRDYPPALVTEAIETAMAYNVYSYDGVLNILGQLLVSNRPKINPVSKDKLQSIPEVVVIPPDLSKYSVLMPGGGQ
ncbi:MAG TPA: IS21 family transposase, partial [Candidatus Diapherotrites archaeon]|nr:IS21 family transposase [Candidatus Diapherotrites archaeon]